MMEAWIQSFREKGLWLDGQVSGAVDHVTSDSREALSLSKANPKAEIAYFARRGQTHDGHDFIKDLISVPQVKFIVCERVPEVLKAQKSFILVRDATQAMGLALQKFHHDPTGQAFTVAVTGTNGKTTTTYLCQALLKSTGLRVVRTGTIETEFEGWSEPAELTSPDFSRLLNSFSQLRQKGANSFVFEASSHALDQKRLCGIEIDAAVFTNLSPEHLDYHQTMERYFEAKKKLFLELLVQSHKKKKIACLPLDGGYGTRLAEEMSFLKEIQVSTWSFTEKKGLKNHLWIKNWATSLEGSSLEMDHSVYGAKQLKSRLVGKHNIENIAGVVALAAARGDSFDLLQRAVENAPPVPGRLERVETKKGHVFVDYAHTPDALENVLMTLRPLTRGRLKVVFGCGGDRDRQKRPKMGAIAELYADELYVTSDNPRTENPESIIEEILIGLQRLKPVSIKPDRREAIGEALSSLGSEDVLLIAGKGHENYQILGTQKFPFDDREVVTKLSQAR